MYPHLIEVHQNGIPMLMNINHVICASDKCNKQEWKSVVMVTGCSVDEAWGLDESYDELKELIRSAGCHIEKGDPRLDQTKHLTMDDLKHMIGEPVWNSNSRCWMLVSEDRGDTVFLIHNDGTGYDFHENALIKYPLYRMKR